MKLGRPTKYRKSFLQKAQDLWGKGLTDVEVAKKLNVSVEVIYNWQKVHPAFLQAKLSGKAMADQLVEKGLWKRATGFIAPDVHVSQSDGKIIVTPLERHYPPDTAACVFWLKNRKPKEWRDRQETEISGPDGGPIEIKFYLPKKEEIVSEKPLEIAAGTNGDGQIDPLIHKNGHQSQ